MYCSSGYLFGWCFSGSVLLKFRADSSLSSESRPAWILSTLNYSKSMSTRVIYSVMGLRRNTWSGIYDGYCNSSSASRLLIKRQCHAGIFSAGYNLHILGAGMGVRPKKKAPYGDYGATHHSDPRWANPLQEEDRDVASVAAGPASGTAVRVQIFCHFSLSFHTRLSNVFRACSMPQRRAQCRLFHFQHCRLRFIQYLGAQQGSSPR